MVVHIDKLKACVGSTPKSWISVEPSVMDKSSNEAMILEENTLNATKNEEFAGESIPFESATGRPKRNARKPARYCCRMRKVRSVRQF